MPHITHQFRACITAGKEVLSRPLFIWLFALSTTVFLISSAYLANLSLFTIIFTHPEISTHNRLVFLLTFCLSIREVFPSTFIFLITLTLSGLSGMNLTFFIYIFTRKYKKIHAGISRFKTILLGFVLGILCLYSNLAFIGIKPPLVSRSASHDWFSLFREVSFLSISFLLLTWVLFHLGRAAINIPTPQKPLIAHRSTQKHHPRNLLNVSLFIGLLIVSLLSVTFLERKALSLFLWNTFHLERLPLILDPYNPDLYYAMGDAHFGGSGTYNVNQAQKYYINAIHLRYIFLDAHYQLGRTYFIQGNFARALFEIREVLRIDPEFKKAYYMYGLISGYQGNLDEAIYGFSEFVKRDDFNWAGYNDLAWIYFRKGDYEKTRDTAREGLKHAETNPWLHNIHGTALMNLGEKKMAEQEFMKALNETETMTPIQWGGAYPGNDPKVYSQGLDEMKTAIRHNLGLIQN